MNNLETILKNMAESRPVFHNEQDFQFEYAWRIRTEFPEWKIRFERPFEYSKTERRRIDLWLEGDGVTYAIELKYKHRDLICTINNEYFYLKDDGAADIGRYDFVSDIARMEEVKKKSSDVRTFAIIITNMSGFWNPPKKIPGVASDFAVYDGNIFGNQICEWRSPNDPKSSIPIQGEYELHWEKYSTLNTNEDLRASGIPMTGGDFRYLFIEIS